MIVRFRVWQALVWCGMLAALVGVRPSTAQTSPLTSEELAALSYLPLGEALVALQNELGIDLAYDPAMVEGRWSRQVRPRGHTPEEILAALLDGTGISFYRLDTGTYALETDAAYVPSGYLIGRVHDAATGVPIPQAHVRLNVPAEQIIAAGMGGHFDFGALSPGAYRVTVSHVGYETRVVTVVVGLDEPTAVSVSLRKRVLPLTLTPLVVEDVKILDDFSRRRPLAAQEALRQINGLGAADAVRGLAEVSGVQVGEALANIHIQGGNSGEHQFRLDGVPVFEPVHLRGLVGAFNPFALEAISVHKAGFSVAEGSYLAGVINAEHTLGGGQTIPLDLQLDPMSLNARAILHTGSPERIQAQLMAAYRTSVWNVYSPSRIDSLLVRWNRPDPFLLRSSLLTFREVVSASNPSLAELIFNRLIPRLDSLPPVGRPDLGFSDVHVAGQLRARHRHTLHASYYLSRNHLESRRLLATLGQEPAPEETLQPDRYAWLNENAQVHLKSLLTPSALLTTRLYTSRYRLNHSYSALDQGSIPSLVLRVTDSLSVVTELTPSDDGNRIREQGFSTTLDLDVRGAPVQFGLEAVRTGHRFQIEDAFTRTIAQEDTTWRLAAFAEPTLTPTPWLTMIGGARLTYLSSQQRVYAEPRFDIRLRFPETPVGGLAVRGAVGLYRQFFNQFELSNISPSIIFPALRFWMPVDSTVAPPKAYHVAGDLAWQPGPAWRFQLEGYYKDQQHLLQIDYPSLWQRNARNNANARRPITTQAGFLRSSRGHAYGTAVRMEYAVPKLSTSARYEYQLARRQYVFRDKESEETVPWGEPHRIELGLNVLPHPRFSADVRWRMHWGRAWAFRRAYYDFLGIDPAQGSVFGRYDFREPGAHLLPAFRQLDLGAAYTQSFGGSALQLRFDVLNVLNQRNVFERTLLEITDEEDDSVISFVPEDRLLIERTFSMALRLRW